MKNLIKDEIYVGSLPSGLKYYIIKKLGYKLCQCSLNVNFGSADLQFELNNEIIQLPVGIAHFLEHQMFNKIDYNPFDIFSKLGGEINAYTNFNSTSYYFTTSKNFEQCLIELIKLVTNPCFEKEQILKESKIIIEEIKMGNDDASFKVFFDMMRELYNNETLKYPIVGTEESVLSIDSEILQETYNNFYIEKNFSLVCVGDFDVDNIKKMIEKNFYNVKSQKNFIKRKYILNNKSKDIQHYDEKKNFVDIPIFSIGFKQVINNICEDIAESNIIIELLFGESSDFYEKEYDNNLIDQDFSGYFLCGDFFATTILTGKSQDPKLLLTKILQEIKDMQNINITDLEEKLDQIKIKLIGKTVKKIDNIGDITYFQSDLASKNISIMDIISAYKNVNTKKILNRLKSQFTDENYNMSVVKG